MPEFVLYRDVHENVRSLRVALGSVARELSRDDLADLIRKRHPKERAVGKSSIERWEDDSEPDIHSIAIMADLAKVSFEAFAKGDPEASAPPWVRPAVPKSGVARGTKPETGLPQFPMKPIAASQPATEKKRRRGGA